ncbi:MAG: hypothetical protein AABX11_02490, partial [Nanoarchaeota archaeon]
MVKLLETICNNKWKSLLGVGLLTLAGLSTQENVHFGSTTFNKDPQKTTYVLGIAPITTISSGIKSTNDFIIYGLLVG